MKESYQLLVLIATPKLADKAADLFLKSALPIQYRLTAQGTASSEIMDTLGLGSTDKGILLSTVPRVFGNEMLKLLHSKLRLDAMGSGIAFTIPLTGANNLLLQLMQHTAKQIPQGKEESAMMTRKYALIAAVVNRGFSDDVMEAARGAGAGGGTVLHSRSIGSEDATKVWGLGVQEEKEVVLILAETENKVAIMTAISETYGVRTEAGGIVTALPIDDVMGL